MERLTTTLPADVAATIEDAVATSDSTSTSEVVCQALRDWKTKLTLHLNEFAAIKAVIDKDLADVAYGRVAAFDPARIT